MNQLIYKGGKRIKADLFFVKFVQIPNLKANSAGAFHLLLKLLLTNKWVFFYLFSRRSHPAMTIGIINDFVVVVAVVVVVVVTAVFIHSTLLTMCFAFQV